MGEMQKCFSMAVHENMKISWQASPRPFASTVRCLSKEYFGFGGTIACAMYGCGVIYWKVELYGLAAVGEKTPNSRRILHIRLKKRFRIISTARLTATKQSMRRSLSRE